MSPPSGKDKPGNLLETHVFIHRKALPTSCFLLVASKTKNNNMYYYSNVLKSLNTGSPLQSINLPFATNEKLMVLGVQIVKDIKVFIWVEDNVLKIPLEAQVLEHLKPLIFHLSKMEN